MRTTGNVLFTWKAHVAICLNWSRWSNLLRQEGVMQQGYQETRSINAKGNLTQLR